MQATKKKQQQYNKVSNEQRDLLIDLLSQNDQIQITEAADLLSINYESAKSIWNILKKEGRKHKVKEGKKRQDLQNDLANQALEMTQGRDFIDQFDQKSEQLRKASIECTARDSEQHFLQFSKKLLMIGRRKAKDRSAKHSRCDYIKTARMYRKTKKTTCAVFLKKRKKIGKLDYIHASFLQRIAGIPKRTVAKDRRSTYQEFYLLKGLLQSMVQK